MSITLHTGDCRAVLATLPDASVHCVVTSPPYWGLRDYGTAKWEGGDAACDHLAPLGGGFAAAGLGDRPEVAADKVIRRQQQYAHQCRKCGAIRVDSQIGLEPDFRDYVAAMVAVFREVRRVLRKDGTLWLNLGSSYASGDMSAIPSRRREHVPAYGSDGITQPNSNGLGFACSDLCDECLADFLNHHGHTIGIGQRPSLDGLQPLPTNRGNGHSDFDLAPRPALPHDVPLSTKIEFWRRQRGACLRCDSRASGLSAVRSSSADARASAHSSWLNYSGMRMKPKDMVPIPWMVAMALQMDGWYLRQDIIWSKPNPMPESVTDRCTKAHEYLFLLAKSERYYYDAEAIKEEAAPYRATNYEYTEPAASGGLRGAGGFKDWRPDSGRNKRSVWEIATQPFSEAHFATFPPALIEPCIKAGTSERGCCAKCGAPWVRKLTESQGGKRSWHDHAADATHGMAQCKHGQKSWDSYEGPKTIGWSPSCKCDAPTVPCTVLDPFGGAGTTGLVADRLQRNAVLIELNPDYSTISERRIRDDAPLFIEMDAMSPSHVTID